MIGGVDGRGEDVGRARLLGILRAVDDLVVDLLDEIHLRGADRVLAADLGHVPFDVAGLDHGAELAEIGRARLDDADAVLLLEAVEEGLAHRRAHRAAGMVDDDLGRLGRLLGKGLAACRERRGASQYQCLTTAHDLHWLSSRFVQTV